MVNSWNHVSIREVNDKFKIKKYTDTLLDARWGLEVDKERTQYMIMSDQQNADIIIIYWWWFLKKKTVLVPMCENSNK